MAEKFNFFHHRVLDPREPAVVANSAPAPVNESNGDTPKEGSDESTSFRPNRQTIIGIAVLICICGAVSIDWSGSSARHRHGYGGGDEVSESAPDPEYLKIKGRNVESARSGRGILHGIFCRGNQRSSFCSK